MNIIIAARKCPNPQKFFEQDDPVDLDKIKERIKSVFKTDKITGTTELLWKQSEELDYSRLGDEYNVFWKFKKYCQELLARFLKKFTDKYTMLVSHDTGHQTTGIFRMYFPRGIFFLIK